MGKNGAGHAAKTRIRPQKLEQWHTTRCGDHQYTLRTTRARGRGAFLGTNLGRGKNLERPRPG
eukprot:9573184-Lingulodinium_polyedra.AAC.1